MKSFYRQIIPESSCARKENVDMNILVTTRNGDRKIMQYIRITSTSCQVAVKQKIEKNGCIFREKNDKKMANLPLKKMKKNMFL